MRQTLAVAASWLAWSCSSSLARGRTLLVETGNALQEFLHFRGIENFNRHCVYSMVGFIRNNPSVL
ncbi:hypothetical protein [Halomonas sp. TA22]|uniref:hypothetical protein n=1 Tax=Halomonas sp. TA22 TaxID=2730914 RepID=UPI001ABF9D4E|nr:hypothetical protein [Halomonas sp. TA22]